MNTYVLLVNLHFKLAPP